jgi:hypothetical protein
MFAEQQGKCAICKCDVSDKRNHKSTAFTVDHSHTTGITRGLLCKNCNLAIGLMADKPDWCTNAAAYLEKHAAVYSEAKQSE